MITTKDAMCETAIGLFRENGYENTTIPMICKACGVTKGSFYHHFESKGQLLFYWLFRKLHASGEIDLTADGPRKEKLRLFLRERAEILSGIGCDLIYNAMLFDATVNGRNMLEAVTNKEGLIGMVQDMIDCGEIRSHIDAERLLGSYILGVIGTIFEWKLGGEQIDVVQQMDDVFEIVFR